MTSESEQRRIAEMLYDELTGRGDGDPLGPNAALAWVEYHGYGTERDRAIEQCRRDADYLGLEIHHKTGNRWALAERLAQKVDEALRNPLSLPELAS